MKPAAYLVVNPAEGHVVEGKLHDLEGLGILRAKVGSQKKFVCHRLWKLGLNAHSAVDVIELSGYTSIRLIHHVRS